MAKTIREAELALTKAIAAMGGGGYVLGTNLFRGQLPEGSNGLAVVFGSEFLREDGDVELPKHEVQVVARYESRADCQAALDFVRTNFPQFGLASDGVVFPSIIKRGDGAVVQDQLDGRKVWQMFSNLLVCWRDE